MRCEGAAVERVSPWVSCLDGRVSYGIEYTLGCGLAFLVILFMTKPHPFLFGLLNNTLPARIRPNATLLSNVG